MKLCINCKHYLVRDGRQNYHQCMRDATEVISLITGKKYIQAAGCISERGGDWTVKEKHCGPEGKFFEDKS